MTLHGNSGSIPALLAVTRSKRRPIGRCQCSAPSSCSNHTGHSGGWILEWDGAKFVKASDLIMPDSEAISKLEMAKAQEYAEANAPWPVNEDCEM